MEAATAPLREEIEALKKSQGISNQQDTDVVEKTEVKNLYGMAYCKPEGG